MITHKKIYLAALICFATHAFADDSPVFFDKNYVTSGFGDEEGDNSGGKIYKKVKEYQDSLKEEADTKNRPTPESEKLDPSEIAEFDKKPKTIENDFGIKEVVIPELLDSPTQEEDKGALLEPIEVASSGGVTIEAFISGEPHNHLFTELKRLIEAKHKPGVKVSTITVIGKPFSDEEMRKLVIALNPKESTIHYKLALDKDHDFASSPVWIVSTSSKKLIYEGKFKTSEIFK